MSTLSGTDDPAGVYPALKSFIVRVLCVPHGKSTCIYHWLFIPNVVSQNKPQVLFPKKSVKIEKTRIKLFSDKESLMYLLIFLKKPLPNEQKTASSGCNKEEFMKGRRQRTENKVWGWSRMSQ